MSNELRLGGTYRHYKTKGLYQVCGLVKNTGDGRDDEMMVLYYSFESGLMFTRPLKEFEASVEVGNVIIGHGMVPRFELVS